MAIDAQPTQPNRLTQTQEEFSGNASAIVDWMGDFADDLNAVSSTYLLGITTTSVTSNSIGTGSKSFTVQTGLGFVLGNNVTIANSVTNYMTGAVASYDSGTGALVVNVTDTGGSGTYTSWTISLAAVGANDAASVAFTPAGNIAATDVQSAIEELDSEKLSSSTGAVTGTNLEDIITGGSIGSLTTIPALTYDANGRVTAASGVSKIAIATLQATTSGTSKDFTSIPSGVKRITVMFNAVSTNGTSPLLLQIGDSGGLETSSYLSAANTLGAGLTVATSNSGYVLAGALLGSETVSGAITLTLMDAASFMWVASGCLGRNGNAGVNVSGGVKALSATLDRLRITTVNGTDAFDAGSVNIAYE